MDHLVDIKTWHITLIMNDLVFPTLQNTWIQGSRLAQLHTKVIDELFWCDFDTRYPGGARARANPPVTGGSCGCPKAVPPPRTWDISRTNSMTYFSGGYLYAFKYFYYSLKVYCQHH